MDLEKVKLIIRNMELLLDNLKSEVYKNEIKHLKMDVSPPLITDYDEIFEDSELYD
jgi:hypothetical protein